MKDEASGTEVRRLDAGLAFFWPGLLFMAQRVGMRLSRALVASGSVSFFSWQSATAPLLRTIAIGPPST